MRPRTRRLILVFVSVACLLLAATSHWLSVANGDDARPKGAWQPPAEDRATYRDIVDFNIFRADRSRIAESVDKQRNPSTPRDTPPRETTQVVEQTPKDPDASWRLSGISHDTDGAVAYIEHTETGELAKIQGEDDFSAGRITAIGYESLVYTVDDTKRTIRVGETLLGERIRPAGSATTGSSGGSSSKPASLEERLKALREQRARELGEAPSPAPAPEEGADNEQDTETDQDTDTPPAEDAPR